MEQVRLGSSNFHKGWAAVINVRGDGLDILEYGRQIAPVCPPPCAVPRRLPIVDQYEAESCGLVPAGETSPPRRDRFPINNPDAHTVWLLTVATCLLSPSVVASCDVGVFRSLVRIVHGVRASWPDAGR